MSGYERRKFSSHFEAKKKPDRSWNDPAKTNLVEMREGTSASI
jgi:hypothetical protein